MGTLNLPLASLRNGTLGKAQGCLTLTETGNSFKHRNTSYEAKHEFQLAHIEKLAGNVCLPTIRAHTDDWIKRIKFPYFCRTKGKPTRAALYERKTMYTRFSRAQWESYSSRALGWYVCFQSTGINSDRTVSKSMDRADIEIMVQISC